MEDARGREFLALVRARPGISLLEARRLLGLSEPRAARILLEATRAETIRVEDRDGPRFLHPLERRTPTAHHAQE